VSLPVEILSNMCQNIILLLKYCSRLIFFSVSLVFQIVLDHPVSWHLGDFGIILFFVPTAF
jgi:hypothetical protein